MYYNKSFYSHAAFKVSCVLALVIIVEIIAIVMLNGGKFLYILDDPYIHLSVADNLANGHYGINHDEFSTPSSSIVWPFLLAPFAKFSWFEFVPLVFGVVFIFSTLFILFKILSKIFENDPSKNVFVFCLLSIACVVFNFIGLIFMGMEQTLQVFLTAALAWVLIVENKNNKLSLWIFPILFFLAVCRYESMAIILPAAAYLFFRSYKKSAVISMLIVAIPVALFSLFLYSNSGVFLPSSIVVKSSNIFPFDAVKNFTFHLAANVFYPRNIVIFILSFAVYKYVVRTASKDIKALFLLAMAALTMQIVFGKSGVLYLSRYEIYANVFVFLILIYVSAPLFIEYICNHGITRKIKIYTALLLLFSFDSMALSFAIPFAANNIYEQQYQLHKFITQIYKKPIAANDIGLVSYKNEKYVLDLFGLAYYDSYKMRLKYSAENPFTLVAGNKAFADNPDWMVNIAHEKNINLVMIYDAWFKIPKQWVKLAELHLSRPKITVAESVVAFYFSGTQDSDMQEAVGALKKFSTTLPEGVVLTIF